RRSRYRDSCPSVFIAHSFPEGLTCTCMHVMVVAMRTTIEISDAQRARLLEIAGRRGEKGFSRLVQEALDRYLAEEGGRRERIEAALGVGGTVSAKAADALEASVLQIRSTWR